MEEVREFQVSVRTSRSSRDKNIKVDTMANGSPRYRKRRKGWKVSGRGRKHKYTQR